MEEGFRAATLGHRFADAEAHLFGKTLHSHG